MKNAVILLALVLVFTLSGCNTYYYSVVQSYEERVPQNADGSFTTVKNDIVLTYSFVNQDGEVVYDIYNQSQDPIYVDWSKSVLIAEDQAIQYKQPSSGYTKTYQLSDNTSVASSDENVISTNKLVLSDDVMFIPPHSRVSYSPIALYNLYNMELKKSVYQNVQIDGTDVKGVYFTPQTSPFLFRSYLTVVNSKNNTETVFEDIFYISSAYKTTSQNNILMRLVRERGDTFYGYRVNSTGKVLGWTAVIGLVVIGAAVAPADEYLEPDYY